ncbi:lactonase family protein [Sphingomonas sp. M1-B02]|uniref:lactonase family protein n=1 Tax=Sphingomonas sp. M1-B02 TaxID=3114300 RepID=UPI00223EC407|nr:lactonase family protein [Sphingomonas sp. S6-11]UZK65355.1 lactonase family protein [Sphingomonas sp. S6-11]
MELHVGTYTDAGGAGLYRLPYGNGSWSLGEAYGFAPNASFGAYSRRYDLNYLVDERDEGVLRVLRRVGIEWQPLARLPTQGALPCYVALSADEAWLAVANYGSGSMALFRLDSESGLPGDPVALRTNQGHGPVADRQEGPHAHCVIFSPDGRWLYQTDLGTDQVLAFAFDGAHGLADAPRVAFAAAAGSGPRHLVFHPHRPIAFLVSELASTLTMFDVGEGALSARQSVSTLPSGFGGKSLGGHIGINAAGDRIYVTNRGHDSIATFALDAAGRVSLLEHIPSEGASPRFFLLLDERRRMLVANEEGNSVTVFEIEPDGTLAKSAEVAVPAPVFLFAQR